MKPSVNQLIARIASGGEKEVVHLYERYKKNFIRWAHHQYNLSKEDALDVFQDTMIAFYKSVRLGQLTAVNHSIKTYLYSIAKNMILTRLRRDQKMDRNIDDLESFIQDDQSDSQEDFDMKQMVSHLMGKMGEPCYTLLRLYYYNNYSMEAIAREIKSKNANVVKAQKARCIKSLKNILEENIKKETSFLKY